MREWITTGLMLFGALWMLLAALGLLRMPDLFTRMQAATKASTLGVGCMMLAVATAFGTIPVTAKAVLIIGFFFLTAPIAAHIIARAAYHIGVVLWEGTVVDEFREQAGRESFLRSRQPTVTSRDRDTL